MGENVCVSDVITTDPCVLRGHGTLLRSDGSVVASRCGRVERWNQLVLVSPLAGGYTPTVGHMVLGRVVQVLPSKCLLFGSPEAHEPHFTALAVCDCNATYAMQVEGARWLVDIRTKMLAVLPMSTAGVALRQAAVTCGLFWRGLNCGGLLQLPISTAKRHVQHQVIEMVMWSCAG
jgi:exosome complex RNA-binding protein Rrp4